MMNNTMNLWHRFCSRMAIPAEELRARAELSQSTWPQEFKLIQDTADELLENIFWFRLPWDMEQTKEPVRFDGEINWEYKHNGDPEFIFQMNRHRNWSCLGQAYALTGREEYARCFVNQMLDWLKKEPLNEDTKKTTWRTIETGLRADYWVRAMALFANSPSVTENVIEAFFAGLTVHAEHLAGNPAIGFSTKSNWGVIEYTGLYVLSLVLDRADWHEQAVTFLRRDLATQVTRDGKHWEASDTYHNEVLLCFQQVLYMADVWGDTPFTEQEKSRIFQMARATMLSQNPGGRQSMTGDSDDTDVRDLVSQGALLFQSGLLKTGGFPCLDYEGIWMFGTEGFRAYQALPVEQPPVGLVSFSEAGQAYWRSSWDKGADWIHFLNGPLGGGHGHFDNLHLDLWLDGEEVLLDSGRGTYMDVPLRYELKEPQAHNVPVAGGKPFAQCESTWVNKTLPQTMPMTAVEEGENLFLEGYIGGYLPTGPLVHRRVVSVNADILVISDEILAEHATELAQYYHFSENIRLTEKGDRLEGRGEKCAFVMQSFCHGAPLSIETDRAPLARHYNTFAECPRAVVREPAHGMVTTILVRCHSGEPVQVQPEQPYNPASGRKLSWQEAEGYVVQTDSRRTGVVLLHQNVGNDAELNGLEGVYGLGRTMVCDLQEKPLAMTVLQW